MTTRQAIGAAALALVATLASDAAWAHRGWYGYGYGAGWYGPRYGVYVGGPWYWGAWSPAWYWGAPAHPYTYGYGYPAYAYGYPAYAYGYPAYGVRYPSPATYIERSQPAAPNLWYYCNDPAGYYPHVQACAQRWIEVQPFDVRRR